jgi:hypothetical protein
MWLTFLTDEKTGKTAKSIKVDQVRELVEFSAKSAQMGGVACDGHDAGASIEHTGSECVAEDTGGARTRYSVAFAVVTTPESDANPA